MSVILVGGSGGDTFLRNIPHRKSREHLRASDYLEIWLMQGRKK